MKVARAPEQQPPAQTSGKITWRAPMAKTVAEQFVETLAAAGVKRIYGIVGDSLNGLTDAIRRQGKIEWIHSLPSAPRCSP
jgi:hypothetical protein